MTGGWNFADVWETIADHIPEAPALAHGDRRITWREMDRRADGVAAALLEAGLGHQDKVAQYLYNGPEYVESLVACCKVGLVPVNTNYRYGDDELTYLWDNADAAAVVFSGALADRAARVRPRLPGIRAWLWVDDGSGPCPEWALPYEQAAAGAATVCTVAPWGRSGDDLWLLYTGGTTGLPKGVMWRQHDLYLVFCESTLHDPAEPDLDAVRARIGGPGPVCLPACPLMHGTGLLTALQVQFLGGTIVTLPGRSFDVVRLLDTVTQERVNSLAIVGDAFARPILDALDAEPGRWDVAGIWFIASSGAMWSEPVKQGLLRHHPGMLLIDVFSSSEAIGLGQSISTGSATGRTASFTKGGRARVVDDEGRDLEPGSGQAGRVALRGPCPVGYYKDPAKSAQTFPVIDGERWSVPGDYATVDADGTLQLLGRGSVCINTGGEKVFPEEVEEVLKEHAAVRDAVVVGLPDERFGETVCAVVEPVPGTALDESDLVTHVKSRLASYKAPRRVVVVDSVGRAPNGKVDYKRLRARAAASVAAPS